MPIFNHQQPALSLNESLALFGVFPTFGGGGGGCLNMGMFHIYAFGYYPGGAAIAQGQLLPMNGQTTFQLPDLNARRPPGRHGIRIFRNTDGRQILV